MISVIICSIDEAKLTRVSRSYAFHLREEEFEIIGIRDAKSLCEGYNRGFRQSKGSILIFSHDDIEILSPDFAVKLKQALDSHDVVGVVGTTAMANAYWAAAGQPHIHGVAVYPPGVVGNPAYLINVFGAETPVVSRIQGLDGMFIAARRKVVEQLGFDEQTFDAFHCYDSDFSFSAYLAGFRVAVSTEIIIAHQSAGNFGGNWPTYNARFVEKHRASLYSGAIGVIRGVELQAPNVITVLRLCAQKDLAEMTAELRNLS